MRHFDEDTITQAVIARHAAAGDTRLRELMTSLVQHLHAFAREVHLTPDEWRAGLAFLGECGRLPEPRQELALLSDTLGLSTLVAAMHQRAPRGATEAVPAGTACQAVGDETGEVCFLLGRVLRPDGAPVPDASVQVALGGHDDPAQRGEARSKVDGSFVVATRMPGTTRLPTDGPVGRMLGALGRPAWRPAHLSVHLSAPGYRRLATQLFPHDAQHLDADAAFGVRRALVVDGTRHPPGTTPEDERSDQPFRTLRYDFVLSPLPATGDAR